MHGEALCGTKAALRGTGRIADSQVGSYSQVLSLSETAELICRQSGRAAMGIVHHAILCCTSMFKCVAPVQKLKAFLRTLLAIHCKLRSLGPAARCKLGPLCIFLFQQRATRE